MTELRSLTQKHGDAMEVFVLKKLAKDRAYREFEVAQREVSYLEDEIRSLKWEQQVV